MDDDTHDDHKNSADLVLCEDELVGSFLDDGSDADWIVGIEQGLALFLFVRSWLGVHLTDAFVVVDGPGQSRYS